MKIRFLGAVGTVTGSRYLLQSGNTRLLIDCGLFQGVKAIRSRNWKPFPGDAGAIDAVVLTHAHLDHSGYLPRLMREGFRGPIHCTAATHELARILLADSAHLQEEDARHANRHGYSKHDPAEPLYTREDAERVMQQFRSLDFDTPLHIGPFTVRLSPAGHIPGSACVHVSAEGKTVIFSGDVGRPDDPVMRPPRPLPPCDYLVLESTYGDRRHVAEDVRARLAGIVHDTISHGGTLMVPAFAVGRTQVMTHLLAEMMAAGDIPTLPIYLDSPMGIDATELFHRHREEHRLDDAQCRRMGERLVYVRSSEESQALLGNHYPKIIIAGAGMLNGGRILHHLRNLGSDPRNTLLITGYQAEGTRGHALLNGGNRLRIYGEEVAIRCRVEQLQDLSAHADYQELLDWLHGLPAPRITFVTHGEPLAADHLRQLLEHERHWPAITPEQGDEFELN